MKASKAAAVARRQSMAALGEAMVDPSLVAQQMFALTETLAETAALLEELLGMKVPDSAPEKQSPQEQPPLPLPALRSRQLRATE